MSRPTSLIPMSVLAIIMLAFSMSMDAFVVSIGRGAAAAIRPRFGEALRTGLVFGCVEAITPIMGWLAGVAASQAVEAFDHWIAFGLLCGVGLHMFFNALRHKDDEEDQQTDKTARTSFFMLVLIAIGTSLDAMAIGVSLAFLDVNIFVIAAAIGFATFLMSTLGILLGRMINARLGRIAEAGAGLVLIGLGINILLQHLSA